VLSRPALTQARRNTQADERPAPERNMTDIFAIETPARTAGLAVRAKTGFRFYASDHAFAGLEGRSYRTLEDVRADVSRLTSARHIPSPARRPGRRRR
jgi:hypothetical protein